MIVRFLSQPACQQSAASILGDLSQQVTCEHDGDVLCALVAHPGAILVVDVSALQEIGLDALFRLDDAVQANGAICVVMVPEEQSGEEAILRSMTRLRHFWRAPFLRSTLPAVLRERVGAGGHDATQQTIFRDLPPVVRGRLGHGLLFDLLWVLRLQGWAGTLTLEARGSVDGIRVGRGRLLHPESEVSALLRLFAWDSGHYRFEGGELPPGAESEGIPIEELLLQAFHAHTTLNENAAWLQESAGRHLHVAADAATRLGEVLRFGQVRDVLAVAESRPGVDALWQAGSQSPRMLATLRFCAHVGAIGFLEHAEDVAFICVFRLADEEPLVATSSLGMEASSDEERDALIREIAETIRARRDLLDSEQPGRILEVSPEAEEDEVEAAYYAALRENHPDIYAHVRDTKVRRMAEELFLLLRSRRMEILRTATERPERGGEAASSAAHPASGKEGSSGKGTPPAQTRREVIVNRPGEGRRVVQADVGVRSTGPASSSRSVPKAVSLPKVDAREVRGRASRLAEQARAMKSAGERAQEPSASSPERAERRAAVERLRRKREAESGVSSESMMRAAHQAMEGGAWQRAYDVLESLQSRDDFEDPVLPGMIAFCEWQLGQLEEGELQARLRDLAEKESGEARSRALTLQGHVERLNGQYTKAAALFKEAVRAFPDNYDAFRWHRYCNGRKDIRRRTEPGRSSIATSSRSSATSDKGSGASSGFDLGRLFRKKGG